MQKFIAVVARLCDILSDDTMARVMDAFGEVWAQAYKEGRESENRANPHNVIDLRLILQPMYENRKIDAIKELRSQTGCGLREGKDFCENLVAVMQNHRPD